MKRISELTRGLFIGLVLPGLAACDKPTEEDCQKAIENMQALLGTEHLATDIPGTIRSCRTGSSRKAVACASAAKTIEELRACDFMSKKPAGSAGSAGSGSAK